jgi:hypothetical protein
LTARTQRDSFRHSDRRAGDEVRSGTAAGFDVRDPHCRPPPRLLTLKYHHARSLFVSSLVLLVAGSAHAEVLSAAPELSTKEAVAAVPLVLGAPPAWMIMALGLAVVSVTVLRRGRKTAPERARR